MGGEALWARGTTGHDKGDVGVGSGLGRMAWRSLPTPSICPAVDAGVEKLRPQLFVIHVQPENAFTGLFKNWERKMDDGVEGSRGIKNYLEQRGVCGETEGISDLCMLNSVTGG